MVEITDGILEVDEPELDIPDEPRALPVEVRNFTEEIRPQSFATEGFNVAQNTVQQILNADPLRESAQITCVGTGQVWLCHSKNAADSVASLYASMSGIANFPGAPISAGAVVPTVATGALWAVATTANMIVGVVAERRQN